MNYVIIGNAAAAVGCIEGIRQIDGKGKITVISAEPYHTYSRPLISYLLMGATTEERMNYRPSDFYKKNKCTLLKGRTAEKIDAAAKTVVLDGGETLAYDKLLVAAGSRPFVPPMEGLESLGGSFTFMTLESAKKLGKVLSRKKRVLIIGAGLIGMKCAEGIAERCGSVTVVEMAPRVLPAVLDAEGAAIIQKQMESRGISFILGDSVKRFSSDGTTYGGKALLNGGSEIAFDVLVTAVGVRPNTALVSDAGGDVGKGITVDSCCRTSLPDVFAAGDCTESDDITCAQRRILALLPNAYMQGETAGIVMASGTASYDNAMPVNAAGFFGLHLVTAGSYTGETLDVPAPGCAYRRFFVQDDLLKGFIIIGDTDRAGIYTSLIRNKVPLSSIDFELIKTHPALMAFGKAKRAEMLSAAAPAEEGA